MKIRILPALVAGVMATTAFLSSCLKSDYAEIEYPVESSIKAFSIGTLHQTIYGKDSEGKDSFYVDTISYADVPFTIDQINRKIYNKDSLPKEVDVTKVLASISADNGAIYYVNKNGKDSLWTYADTLDFTNAVAFKVMAYSELQNKFVFGKHYTVKVNVHKLNPDSLVWKHFGDKMFAEGVTFAEQKAVYMNEYLYVFGKTENDEIKVFKAHVLRGSLEEWNEITPTNTQNINIYSATAFNNDIYNDIYYVADANGKLYNLLNNPGQVGSLEGLSNLISVSNGNLLAYNKTNNKVITINANGEAVTDGESSFVKDNTLPEHFSAISTKSTHNSNIWRTVVMANNPIEAATTANVFSYINSDKVWTKFQPNNPTTCPNQDNISMISYDGKLFAYGEEFDYFYSSTDNGLNWKKEEDYMIFPTENKNGIDKLAKYRNGGSYSTVVEDNGNNGSFIWFIWQDGTATRTCLNRLMPKE